jgi:hypothetical protein
VNLERTLPIVLCLSALLAAGCETTTQRGFNVPGCYDYGGVLEPSIPTVAECDAIGWQWHTQDWKKKVPATPPPRTTR